MFFTIYQITNNINHKIYIGKHITQNPMDSYFGSGVAIRKAIRKYGIQNFTKTVLIILQNPEEMDLLERMVVTEDFCRRRDVYNEMVGGEGGASFTGRHHSEQTKKLLREQQLERLKDPCFVRKMKDGAKRFRDELKKDPQRYKEFKEKQLLGMEQYKKAHSGKDGSPRTGLSMDQRKRISASLTRYYDRIGRKTKKHKIHELKTTQSLSGQRIKVTNGIDEFTIHIEELQWYLDNGWRKGRNPTNKKPVPRTQQLRDNSSGKGKFIVHNDSVKQVKRIDPQELDAYLNDGWKRGYLKRNQI